ncbi:MAG: HAD-IA family hydrolase [Gammaproteobacteria bacterium]|nr:HAD-IA family hydrolase [Gammaproteobacteria bacterium]
MINAVFFDLDGTLLDTARDFAYAINLMLKKRNKPPVDFDLFRESIYGESKKMISFAFQMDEFHPEFETIRNEFLKTYSDNSTKETVFFSGMELLLDHLDAEKTPWGIITNKPAWLTQPIVTHFGLDKRAACIISGDTLAQCKPHPEPLWHACRHAEINPANAVYVGDLQTDIITAKAAGMKSIGVTYGYYPPDVDFAAWNADWIMHSPIEILNWLKSHQISS